MSRQSPSFAFAIAAVSFLAGPIAGARAESCEGLWYSRNAIYKSAGYCFHTPRGIRAFGNAGCLYDDVDAVPLSAQQHRIIADVQRQEIDQGCR